MLIPYSCWYHKISVAVLKEWQHFPWQEEQSPPFQFQVHCQQHPGSAASFPIVWLVPALHWCTLSVKLMDQRNIYFKSIFCHLCNWNILKEMQANFLDWTSPYWLNVILTFHEKSWAMQFWIISFKTGVPKVARALLTLVATAVTSAGSTASHWKQSSDTKSLFSIHSRANE